MKRIICVFVCIIIVCFSLSSEVCAIGEAEINVNAKACILMDQKTGEVLYSKNEHKRLYPASVTKIMSLLLFMEAIDSGKISVDDKVTTSPDAAAKGGSQIWLKDGEVMSVDELLRATAIGSANDACTALGEYVAGSEESFVSLMNERASQLGMNDTHFDNCTGLDDDSKTHLTSAYDIALMSRELLTHDRIQTYSTVWMDSLRNGDTQLVNTNKLVRFYKGTTGLKTGTTSKAGHCLSASAERDSLHLIAVVMGAQNSTDRFESAKSLLNYGFANYESVTPKVDESLLTDVNIIKGVKESVKPKIEEPSAVLLKKGDMAKIKTDIDLCVDVEAPVEKNQVLGTVTLSVEGEKIAEYSLFCPEEIRKTTFFDVMLTMIRSLSVRSCVETTAG